MGYTRTNVIEPVATITGQREYLTFLKYKKTLKKKLQVNSQAQLRLITNSLLKKIGDDLIENEGGVMLRNLGYFFVYRSQRKHVFQKEEEDGNTKISIYKKHGGKKVQLIFYPCRKGGRPLLGWTLDKNFTDVLKKRLEAKLDRGVTYKMYLYSFKKLNFI
jgi:hypothetical protein